MRVTINANDDYLSKMRTLKDMFKKGNPSNFTADDILKFICSFIRETFPLKQFGLSVYIQIGDIELTENNLSIKISAQLKDDSEKPLLGNRIPTASSQSNFLIPLKIHRQQIEYEFDIKLDNSEVDVSSGIIVTYSSNSNVHFRSTTYDKVFPISITDDEGIEQCIIRYGIVKSSPPAKESEIFRFQFLPTDSRNIIIPCDNMVKFNEMIELIKHKRTAEKNRGKVIEINSRRI